MSSSISAHVPTAIMPGETIMFVTKCEYGGCPPGPALRFQTLCSIPGSPIAAGRLTQVTPTAALAVATGSGILPAPDS